MQTIQWANQNSKQIWAAGAKRGKKTVRESQMIWVFWLVEKVARDYGERAYLLGSHVNQSIVCDNTGY